MEPSTRTVVKVSSPADILGVLPHRLGFHPDESIVVVCLSGPRRRDVLVMRLDLLPPDDDEAVAHDIVERVERTSSAAVVLVCYTDEADDTSGRLVRSALVDQLWDGLAERGIDIVDALLVRDGRWWSYCCDERTCCPSAGSLLPPDLTAAAQLYAAESVAQGGVLLRDRDELVRSIRPADGAGSGAAREGAGETAAQLLVDAVEREGLDGVRTLVLETLRTLLADWSRGGRELPPEQVGVIVLGLRDKQARDEAVTLLLDAEPDVLLALLVALARSADDADAAPICTVLAWVAYCHGNGALANVAIERALDCEPAYELALLIEGGLDAMVSPAQVRRLTEQVRRDLFR